MKFAEFLQRKNSRRIHFFYAISIFPQGHLLGRGVGVDEISALELFRESCDRDWASGCSSMAKIYLRGEAVPVDYQQAVEGFQKACDAGEAASCLTLGYLYYRGDGVAADQEQAIALVERACELGMLEACQALEELKDSPSSDQSPRR